MCGMFALISLKSYQVKYLLTLKTILYFLNEKVILSHLQIYKFTVLTPTSALIFHFILLFFFIITRLHAFVMSLKLKKKKKIIVHPKSSQKLLNYRDIAFFIQKVSLKNNCLIEKHAKIIKLPLIEIALLTALFTRQVSFFYIWIYHLMVYINYSMPVATMGKKTIKIK